MPRVPGGRAQREGYPAEQPSSKLSLAIIHSLLDRRYFTLWELESSLLSPRAQLRPRLAGFCAVSKVLPVPQKVQTEAITCEVLNNGLHASFDDTVHVIAAEPDATFLRVSVLSGKRELAFEVAVVGRLRRGFRVFQVKCRQP